MELGFYAATSGALAQMEKLNVISNNLANVDTPGFKQDQAVFDAILGRTETPNPIKREASDFTSLSKTVTDFSQGQLKPTGNPLNLAIEGDGFFKLRDQDGNTFFTRHGNFHLTPEGKLAANNGFTVVGASGELTLPSANVFIDESGNIWEDNEEVGKIDVFSFKSFDDLEKAGNGLFVYAGNAAPQTATNNRLLQGMIEGSNVNAMKETSHMIETQRTFEAYQKVMKTYGALAEKSNEIGSF